MKTIESLNRKGYTEKFQNISVLKHSIEIDLSSDCWIATYYYSDGIVMRKQLFLNMTMKEALEQADRILLSDCKEVCEFSFRYFS